MDFIERDLEDIIFNTNVNDLYERGLGLLFEAHTYRQLKIGNYGIADIVQFQLEKEPWHNGERWFLNNTVRVKIIELKKNEINIDAFLQSLRYAKGIKNFYDKRMEKSKFNCELKISIVLIGKTVNTKDDFCYLSDFLNDDDFELDMYTYSYNFDGISFDLRKGYNLVNKGLDEKMTFSRYKKSHSYYEIEDSEKIPSSYEIEDSEKIPF
jgi:hypothetical protein